MDFAQIDNDEFVIYHNKVKLEKRIVQYAVFDEYDIVVLLVSNTNDWKNRDEVIAIRAEWDNYKVIWTYQLGENKDISHPLGIQKILKVTQEGIERIACLIETIDCCIKTYIFNIETGEVIKKLT